VPSPQIYFRLARRFLLTYFDIRAIVRTMKKRRTTVWLPEDLVARLRRLSEKTGAPMAELFRRAVVAYLKQHR
jgi:hypothetical protein